MKKTLGPVNVLYPTPTTLVGALVNGVPNFITIAHIGILAKADPYLISVSMVKTHYTNQGIKANKAFSVNMPSENLVAETDYAGMFSGKKHDKSELFEVFYGQLGNVPMIKECPLNMECRLHDIYDTPTHDVFIGAIVETYADEEALNDGKVDISQLKPILFDMNSKKYWSIGSPVAQCWSIGKDLKKAD